MTRSDSCLLPFLPLPRRSSAGGPFDVFLENTPPLWRSQHRYRLPTARIVKALGDDGDRLLHQQGRDAGTLAASAPPPLLKELGVAITVDLLPRRITDFQVTGWAAVRGATVNEDLRGELTLADTFESEAGKGQAGSPRCRFLAGFIAGVFSFPFQRLFACQAIQCQATGAATCQFALQPGNSCAFFGTPSIHPLDDRDEYAWAEPIRVAALLPARPLGR